MPSTRSTIPAIPALDGLRGLAVLGILLFHAGHLQGGWLGVDVFFVLSGFLITSLLLAEFASRRDISLVAFWARRARRLLPALFALLFGACAFALLFAAPGDLARIRGDALSTLLYVANWHAILAGHDYWEIFRNPSPLDHTWSLAIEEQFYLLWPPLALLALRRARRSEAALAKLAIGLALLSASWMAFLYDADEGTARLYFGSDTRVAATLVGAGLAALLRERVRDWPGASSRAVDLLAGAALLVLVAGATRLDGTAAIVYRGGLFCLALASAVIVVGIVLAPRGVVSRMLALAPLRGLGLVSYGVYLWHWPLYLVLTPERVGFEGWALTGLRIAVSLAVAALSYVAIERPIRRGAIAPRPLLAAAVVGAAALVACIVLATSHEGRPPPGQDAKPVAETSPGSAPVDVLLVGDSVAFELQPAFLSEARARGLRVGSISREACGALTAESIRFLGGQVYDLALCLELRAIWKKWVTRHVPAVVLVLEGWSGEGEKRVDGEWTHPCTPAFDRAYARDIAELIDAFGRSGSRTALALMPTPIVADLSPRHTRLWGDKQPADLQALFAERMACQNDVRSAVAHERGAVLLDLRGHVCPADGECLREIDGWRLRPDGMHFQGSGAIWATEWLLDELTPHFDRTPDDGADP